MSDDETNQPIDLSFKHVTRSRAITSQHSSDNSFTSSSERHVNLSASVSNPYESTDVLASPLLSYLLLTNERAANMQQLLRLLQANSSNRSEGFISSSIHSQEETSHEPRRCHADTTEHDDEDNEMATGNMRLLMERSRLNHLTSYRKGCNMSASIGRPLTGRYVRNGTGASESTLALLRQMIQMRMNNRRLQEQSTGGSRQRRQVAGRRGKKRM